LGELMRHIFLIASLLAANVLQAQQPAARNSGKIVGTVQADGGVALSGAMVTVRNAADSTKVAGHALTAGTGSFAIDNLPFGKYALRITDLGYKPHDVLNLVLSEAQSSVGLGHRTITRSPAQVAHC